MLFSIRGLPLKRNSDRNSTEISSEESLTVQSDAKGSDINEIVKRFGLTGQLPPVRHVPKFADFSKATDFRGAMQVIVEAREAFESLPSRIRERFVTPEAYVDFCENPDNKDELIKLGLAKPDPVPPKEVISKVEVVNGEVASRKRGRKGDDGGDASD